MQHEAKHLFEFATPSCHANQTHNGRLEHCLMAMEAAKGDATALRWRFCAMVYCDIEIPFN